MINVLGRPVRPGFQCRPTQYQYGVIETKMTMYELRLEKNIHILLQRGKKSKKAPI